MIWETLNLFEEIRIYSKQNAWGESQLLWVMEGDEYEVAFQTMYSLFEPTVMQFGTTKASADCQWYINSTSREALDDVQLE